ncbi:MAG TPA: hypothetical protein VLG50_05345 [Candidatus Saccharimonadales bacterium]|nr:hypothetical protein [Candidatus Saccharimonadales bacterium]
MNKPFITIVYNQQDNQCRLLLLFQDDVYYSSTYTYKELIYFKQPLNLILKGGNIVLYSKNKNKQELILTKH